MNLIIISFALTGILVVAYSVIYTLLYVKDSALWVRILAMILLFGGYVGVVALAMLLLGIPFS